MFLWIALSVFLIVSILYYSVRYMIEKQILFTFADLFNVVFFGTAVVIAAILIIYLIFKTNNLQKIVMNNSECMRDCKQLLIQLQDDLIDLEDNEAKGHREIQLMIMELSRKLGV